MTTKKGLFITFEGGEGAGKSTLIQQTAAWLRSQNKEVVVTREPGGTPLGDDIRRLLLHHSPQVKICPKAELFLFLASRAQHVNEVILPALEEGKIVLCDRFHDSTIAYQGYARKLGMGETIHFSKWAVSDLEPNLTIYLDIDPKFGIERTQQGDRAQQKNDRMEREKLEFHDRVRRGFLTLMDLFPARIRKVDASQAREAVFDHTLDLIKNLMRNA